MNRCFRRLFPAALLAVALTVGAATTNAPQPARWLLVVNTSAAMERRALAVEGVLGELLASGMNGEMKAGDEIGLWTFNRELAAGVAPLQTWEPARSNLIAGRTVNLLAQLPRRGDANLAPVVAELGGLVADSHRLTVLLFTDARAAFTNLPFADALNAEVAAQAAALEKTRMPLVVVLRSQRGEFVGHSVSLAPWPVTFPAFAAEPTPVTPAPEPAPAPAAPREIHITGKPKPVTPEPVALTNATAVESVSPVPPAAAVEPAATKVALPVVTSAPPGVAEAPRTNVPAVSPPVAAPVQPAPTNPIAAPPAPVAVKPTVAEPPREAAPGLGQRWPLIAGIGFLVVAAGMALWLAFRPRRTGSSLITRSYDHDADRR